ncbi:PAAR-like protein [Flavobacterium piscisymbiosum]|uniref:DUF4280 domain-containing protein n=1 Tax=Flavobacterium piscisymbiosum TaxID=2893753 RepID=A0ABS8MD95_9FLAO|nr:PAAR-like protein [Flavobacterium sp. F-30]MCC9063482.1 DUF4280 domain-containing protein [Flavobacterium sp. F-30]
MAKGEIIVEGAKCFCSNSVINNSKANTVPLTVKSQIKYFAQEKPIATNLDDNSDCFDNGNGFGECYLPNKNTTKPCKAKCSIKYKDYYKNVDFDKRMKVLLDISTGTCPGYGPMGATAGIIQFATTGQKKAVNTIDVLEADAFMVENTSSQWEISDPTKQDSVSEITILAPLAEKPTGKYYFIEKPTNTNIFQLANPLLETKLELKAICKGDSSKVIWAIFKGEGVTNKLKTFVGIGANIEFTLDKLFKDYEEGIYRIEAYANTAGSDKCFILIEYVKDYVEGITAPGKTLVKNTPIPLTLKFKASSFAEKLKILNPPNTLIETSPIAHWRVKHKNIVTNQETIIYNSPINTNSDLVKVEIATGLLGVFTFKNPGDYEIEAYTSPDDPSPVTTKLTVHESLQINTVKGTSNLLLRYNEHLKVEVSKFNVDFLPDNGTKMQWYLQKDAVRLTAFESAAISKEKIINKPINQILFNDARAGNNYFGKYVIEAYAKSGNTPIFNGADSFFFEVIRNAVDKFTMPQLIPKGAKVKYETAARIMPLVGDEKINLELPNNVTDNHDGTLTFNTEGEFEIAAYLTGEQTLETKAKAKIKVANPELKRASWAYGTGYKRTETGYNEETHAFVEIAGLENQPITIKVWVKGANESFYLEPAKYMLEEKKITLNDKGKGSFKITTDDKYKEKIKNVLPATSEAPNPNIILVFTVEMPTGSQGAITLPETMTLKNGKPVAGTKFIEVLDSNEELAVTNNKSIKHIFFSKEDGKGVQQTLTHKGKTHKIWVHTANMQEEELRVDVMTLVHSECIEEKNGIITVLQSIQEYKEKVGSDGLLEFSFTPEEKYLTDAEVNPVRFSVQVSRKVKDPNDDKKEIYVFEDDQLAAMSYPNASLVRSPDMKSIGIKATKQDETPFTKEEKIALRKQLICFKNTALIVEKGFLTPEAIDNCTVPVMVDMEMAEVQTNKDCPRCKEKIILSDLQQVFFNGNKSIMEKCLPYINEYFEKFQINTCKRKAHFFAQVRTETDLVILTESLKYKEETLFNSDLAYYSGNAERCRRDALNDRAIGINAYGSRLGNRAGTEDGFNLRGRGFIMVTGRDNYEEFQKFYNKHREALRLPQEKFITLDGNYSGEHPEKLEEEKYAVLSGVSFWVTNRLNEIVTAGTDELKVIEELVDHINSKTHSRDKRRGSYQGGKYTYKGKEGKYDTGTKIIFKVDECGINKTVTSLNLENSDLKIKEGIEWLLTKAISQDDVANGVAYKVPYENDQNRTLATGENTMDCSELICRYLAKIEWCSKGWAAGTAVLYDYTQDKLSYLVKHDSLTYIPQVGDIFIWKNLSGGMGHTGVITGYDEENDVVTTIEAISSKEQPFGLSRSISMKGVTELKWKRNSKHLLSHPLTKTNKNGGTDSLTSCRFYTPMSHYSKVDKLMKWTSGTAYKIEIIKK